MKVVWKILIQIGKHEEIKKEICGVTDFIFER
jgi:hypothetical protein